MTNDTNAIDLAYSRVAAAVNRLDEADNHWKFQKIAGNHAWWCFNHGHKEALLRARFTHHGHLEFKVYDVGLVRFNNGKESFSFLIDSQLEDQQEDIFFDDHLIGPLNRLHNIT